MPCDRGIYGRFQENLHHFAIAESWTPEVVETRPPNSVGIEASAPAGAIPWMALMAGLLALLAVYWRRKLFGRDALDCEEDDLEVPTLDAILLTDDLESSEEEEELESSDDDDDGEEEEEEEESIITEEEDNTEEGLTTEEINSIEDEEERDDDEEEDEEEEGNEEEESLITEEIDNINDQEEDDKEEERLIIEEIDSIKDEEEEKKVELEDTDQESQLQRQHLEHLEQLDKEKKRLAEDLEVSKVHGGKLECLLNQAKEEIVRLQNQILDKDHLIEKQAAEGTEMLHRAIEAEKDQRQLGILESQILAMKEDHVALQRKLELTKGENVRIKEDLGEKILAITSMKAELKNEKEKTQILRDEVQVMRNWVSELGGENAKIKDDSEDKSLIITALRKRLRDEQEKTQILKEEAQVLKNWVSELGGKNTQLKEDLEKANLEATTLKNSLVNEKRDALHQRKKIENLLERLEEKDSEQEKLRERERQAKEDLESALHQQQTLECSLKRAEGQICSLKKAESTNLRELEQLRKECERLKEKCRMQEENTLEEQKRVREHLRMQEEELRNHDKYMLMALLHGTAQRNFLLEHIALDCRKKSLDNNSKEEEPNNCAETTEGKDQGREEDRHDQVRRVEEEQDRMYHNAQREKDDYGKQWEDLTQMVEDLIQGDERKDC
ncbi:golgin subfamily A member 6-like protein 22 [Macrobrachium rosenbergii]|uniref:golgin subfamily A member 6-like protein 22 n=1 Tax=Macrobrachium rosenbergii TaxID=79674 RepID=UPI0034D395A9